MEGRWLPIYGKKDGRRNQVVSRTLVDAEFFDYVNQWKWRQLPTGYVCRGYTIIPGRKGKKGMIYLHRLISGVPAHLEVDHINRDPQDNQRSNLRCVTHRQNHQNVNAKRGSSSKYRGVCWDKSKGKWSAKVKMGGTTHNLGQFDAELEAATVAATWRKEHMPHTVEELI